MTLQFQIVIEPPDTKANWTTFNRDCEDLNSDFLMQPINEADYDSETQACVDARTGGPRSFYDHYVTKRRKKRGMRGLGVEHPAGKGHGHHQLRVTPTNTVGFGGTKIDQDHAENKEEGGEANETDDISSSTVDGKTAISKQQGAKKRKQMRQAAIAAEKQSHRFIDAHVGDMGEATVAALASPTEKQPQGTSAYAGPQGTKKSSAVSSGTFLTLPTNTTKSAKGQGKASAPPSAAGSNIHPEDFLDVPNKITAAKGALSNAAIRRIACGRNPTPVWNEPTGFKDKPSSDTNQAGTVQDANETSALPTVNTEIIVLEPKEKDKHFDGHTDAKSRRGNWSSDQFSIVVDETNIPGNAKN